MSGYRSPLGIVVRVDRQSMSADLPVSASTTMLARNNLQHLIDQSVQYRVSWIASTVEDGAINNAFLAFPFCTSIVDENTVPSFDLHLTARLVGSSTAGYVRARIASGLNVDRVLHTFSDLTLSSSSVVSTTQHIDLAYPWGRTEAIGPGGDGLATRVTAVAATGVYSARIVPLVLFIDYGDNNEGYVQVCSVQLREYLSQ